MLTLLLAAATKRFIEDPVRHRPFLKRRRAGWTFAAAAVGTAAVIATAAEANSALERDIQHAERRSDAFVASNPRCFGAASRDPQRHCVNPALRLVVVPTPTEAHQQRNFPCHLVQARGYLYICSFGVKRAKAEAAVALIGDSHAAHWRAAMDVVARRRNGSAIRSATRAARSPRQSTTASRARHARRVSNGTGR